LNVFSDAKNIIYWSQNDAKKYDTTLVLVCLLYRDSFFYILKPLVKNKNRRFDLILKPDKMFPFSNIMGSRPYYCMLNTIIMPLSLNVSMKYEENVMLNGRKGKSEFICI